MIQAMIDITSEHNVKQKQPKSAIFSCFELISRGCDFDLISICPWGNSHMELNTNRCHHVYLGWASTIYWKCLSNKVVSTSLR